MKAVLTLLITIFFSSPLFAGDTTGRWIGTLEHKGTGVNTTVWYCDMDLTITGYKCKGNLTYSFMQRNSPLVLKVKFYGDVLDNTLAIEYYSKYIKKAGPDARSILLQYRYKLLLVKHRADNTITGDYVGLSKGMIQDKTTGYIYLEPYKDAQGEEQVKKMDKRMDSLIAVKDNPKPVETVSPLLPAAKNETVVAKKTEQPSTGNINAGAKTLPAAPPVVVKETELNRDSLTAAANKAAQAKKDSAIVKTETVAIKKETETIAVNKPAEIKKDTVTAKKTDITKTENKIPVVPKEPEMIKDTRPVVNTVPATLTKNTTVASKVENPANKESAAIVKARAEAQTKLKARENVVMDKVFIEEGDVMVEFYDNGAIDGDVITVIHNKAITLSNASLTAKALSFSFHIDKANPLHEIVMYAENQGTVPPNTALMVITYGNQRKQVFLSSDDKKSAVVLLELKIE